MQPSETTRQQIIDQVFPARINSGRELTEQPPLPITEIFIATSSYRKALLIATQLRILNGLPIPEVFREALENDQPLEILALLKANFFNGNGAMGNEHFFLGTYQGIPIYTIVNKGEKNLLGLTPLQEAENKATFALKLLLLLQKEGVSVVGMDGLDEVNGEQHMKPSTELPALKDAGPAERLELILGYIQSIYSGEVGFLSTTAIVALSTLTEEIDAFISKLSVTFKLDEEKLLQLAQVFDIDASGGGLIQYILDLHDPKYHEQFINKLPEDARKYAPFFLLCQIMGVPIWGITEVIDKMLARHVQSEAGAE